METMLHAANTISTALGIQTLGVPGIKKKIRMDLKEIGIHTRNWVDSEQDRDYWRTPMDSRNV